MKINCIIQARMGSTPLAGKSALKIGGLTLLQMVLERCLKAQNIEKVIVATHGMKDIDHILHVDGPGEPAARFVKVLATYPCDGFVRVCADSPFIDAVQIDKAADGIIKGGSVCFPAGQPGNNAEGFNTQDFLDAELNMQGDEREHLGLWFHRHNRLTVDTPGDLERARLIVSRMTKPHTEYTAAECLDLLRK